MSKRRITVFDNRQVDEAKMMNIAHDISMNDFLKLCSNKLGFPASAPAKKVFLQDGGVVDDIDIIRDNDVVYISAGEPFFKSQPSSSAAAAAKKAEQCVTYSIAVMGPGSVGRDHRET